MQNNVMNQLMKTLKMFLVQSCRTIEWRGQKHCNLKLIKARFKYQRWPCKEVQNWRPFILFMQAEKKGFKEIHNLTPIGQLAHPNDIL